MSVKILEAKGKAGLPYSPSMNIEVCLNSRKTHKMLRR